MVSIDLGRLIAQCTYREQPRGSARDSGSEERSPSQTGPGRRLFFRATVRGRSVGACFVRGFPGVASAGPRRGSDRGGVRGDQRSQRGGRDQVPVRDLPRPVQERRRRCDRSRDVARRCRLCDARGRLARRRSGRLSRYRDGRPIRGRPSRLRHQVPRPGRADPGASAPRCARRTDGAGASAAEPCNADDS